MSDARERTRRRCAFAELTIGRRSIVLEPVITDAGVLNSLQAKSPATTGGGYVLAVLEPAHGPRCAALGGGACSCGGQRRFEEVVFERT